jgi:hypothetical protein
MALLGRAALAMWWDIAAEVRADFEDWHAHEHFPERLALPGFRRGTRWSSASGGEGMFVLYELEQHANLSSPEYVARLNAPTPWSTRLMPHHRNMVRAQCHVVQTQGGVVARHALTLRLSPAAGQAAELNAFFATLGPALARRPGLTGAHLLRHEAPAMAPTREQAMRRHADEPAQWVYVACGYESSALEALRHAELAPDRLAAHGAEPAAVEGRYTLACSALPTDVEPCRRFTPP